MKTRHAIPLTALFTLAAGCVEDPDGASFRDLTTMGIYHPAGGGSEDCLIWDIKDDTDDAVYDDLGNLVIEYDETTDEIFDPTGALLCSIDGKKLYDSNDRLVYELQGPKVKDATGAVVFGISGDELRDGGTSGPALVESNLSIQATDNDNKLIIAALVGAKCGSAGIPGPT